MEIGLAKSKWCPYGRAFAGDDASPAAVNRMDMVPPNKLTPCLGDGCMAWREHPRHPLEQVSRDRAHELEMSGEAAFGRWLIFDDGEDSGVATVRRGPFGGYCGLAGTNGAT